ncbi:C-type natriuretic peptide 2 [Lampris incognitus]|uniref:C-type natriuretic peptide 2 n=1 Tax=Lampris incognitus TaxID=2546036 RepID=UPI0024B51AC0|nr:C-type natriuretic peptide 2 [Lampris incognitus]
MAASSSSSSFIPLFLLLILLFLTLTVGSQPARQRDKKQVLQNLFGSHLSSLILAVPKSDDFTEGSGQNPTHSLFSSSSSSSRPLIKNQEVAGGLAVGQEVIPQFFLGFLHRHRKLRGRNRKSMIGGRGCFGMKIDRIGSISGLGC